MKDELNKFLSHQEASREVGCIILEGKANSNELDSTLQENGYAAVHDLESFFAAIKNRHKVSWHFQNGDFKPVYDLITQYPTGMLEIFDNATNKTHYYQDPTAPFVLVVSEDSLKEINQAGFDLLSKVGITLRLE